MASRSLSRGGAALLISSVLLVIATVLEAPSLGHPDDRSGSFVAFAVLLVIASVGYLLTGILLAAGRGSIVGASTLGRVGLIGFGLLWLIGELAYLFATYFSPSDGLATVSTVASLLALVGALVGSIVIIRQKLVTGASRWILLITTIVSGVTGGIAGGLSSAVAVTVLHLVSAVVLGIAGVIYLTASRSK